MNCFGNAVLVKNGSRRCPVLLVRLELLVFGLMGAIMVLPGPSGLLAAEQGKADLSKNSAHGAWTAAEPFHWARVKFDNTGSTSSDWNAEPYADVHFLKVLKEETNINVDQRLYTVTLDDLDEMVKHPFLFITDQYHFNLPEKQKQNIKEYLARGGFLYADDCVLEKQAEQDLFFRDFRDMIETMFGQKMVKLPNDHDLFHCFYDLPQGMPHMQGVNHGGWALFLDGRMAILLTAGDIHCGWASHCLVTQGRGSWFSPAQNKDSLRIGINIIIFAMTH